MSNQNQVMADLLATHEIDHMNGLIFLDHIDDPSKLLAVDKNGHLKPMKEIPDDINNELHQH